MQRSAFLVISLSIIITLLSLSSTNVLSQSEQIVWAIHGSGDDVVQIPDLGIDNLFVTRIHGNLESRYFSVKTYDKFGNFVYLLTNTTDVYAGVVPFNFDAYRSIDVSGGLIEIKSEGRWSIEVITLASLPRPKNDQLILGYGDYVGYVMGNSLTARVYGNQKLRYFSVSAIGVTGNSSRGALIINTTSLYDGNVRLPNNKEGIIVIVSATEGWGIAFDKYIENNDFVASDITFRANSYSPFWDETKQSVATITPVSPTQASKSSGTTDMQGTVNRNANLRAGPGTNYAIAGNASVGDKIVIVNKNADGSWLELSDGKWIASFLVNQSLAATPVPTMVANAVVAPTPTPKKPVYWKDAGVQTCGDFEWRIADIRRSKDTWYRDMHQVAQGEYLIFYVEVKNISSDSALFWDNEPTMPDKIFSERASQYAAWMMTGGWNTFWADVKPSGIITLVGAYDVAPDTHTYTFSVESCGQIVEIGSWFELDRGPIKASN